MSTREIRVPDIGDFESVEIIEVLVSPGDEIAEEAPLITLESDKAAMDVPSPAAGIVRELKVRVGDKVSEGSPIVVLEEAAAAPAGEPPAAAPAERRVPERTPEGESPPAPEAAPEPTPEARPPPSSDGGELIEVRVPDIGDFSDVPVIELLVAAGDRVAAEDPLLTLESDKATMDVPAPQAGEIASLHVNVGDTVSEGDLIVSLRAAEAQEADRPPAQRPPPGPAPAAPEAAPSTASDGNGEPVHAPPPTLPPPAEGSKHRVPHASPSIRYLARELGVDLTRVRGSGPKGRILKTDVQNFVKSELNKPAAGVAGIPAAPEIDFASFGPVETEDLPRIKKLSGAHLHRAWTTIPHVTHHEEADVTELEDFRKSLKQDAERQGLRVTGLLFLMKAVVAALKEFPLFNTSLTADGERLVYKRYYHIGIAVDTPRGLVVPVVRDVEKKGIWELAAELGEISARAREGKLKAEEMQGGSMSISNLGGIGGTAFTPIVNAPEVAILGAARSRMQPVWRGESFEPRLLMPLDLSYDHRVIDGAEAARFARFLCEVLEDVRRMLL